jgi:hypothetical protein
MFGRFYLVKTHKIVNNLTSTDARKKIRTNLEFLEFRQFFHVFDYIKKKNISILNKISHQFLVTSKLETFTIDQLCFQTIFLHLLRFLVSDDSRTFLFFSK